MNTIKLTESALRSMIAESVKRVLKEEFRPGLLSNLATVAEEMKQWGFASEGNLIERYVSMYRSAAGLKFDNGVLKAIENVSKRAEEMYRSGEAEGWDDFDDFISLLNSTRQEYLFQFASDSEVNEGRKGKNK